MQARMHTTWFPQQDKRLRVNVITTVHCIRRFIIIIIIIKIFLVLLEMLGFIVSCEFTFLRLINFTAAIVFKPIVNT